METPIEFGPYKTVGGYDAVVYERIKYDGKLFLYGSVKLHSDTYKEAPMFWDENGEVYVPNGKWTLDDKVWVFHPHCKGPGLALLYSIETYNSIKQSPLFNLTTPKPEPMNDSKLTPPIKPGKYKMRNGLQAIICETPGNIKNKDGLCGWYLNKYSIEDFWIAGTWSNDGSCGGGIESQRDLIEPWIDKPEWEWSTTPPWLNWLAMDEGEFWYLYANKPTHTSSGFNSTGPYDDIWSIPKQHAPKWRGDSKGSLVGRPGVEVKP